jgi:hypothetical protein
MLPKPEHTVSFGSRITGRWYPLKPDINKKYIGNISNEDIDIIHAICGETAEKLGYYDTEMREKR